MLARHDRVDTMEWGDLMPDAKGRRSETVLHWLARFFLFFTAAALAAAMLTAPAQAAHARTVVPLGQTVGIKLFSEGVLVVGLSDIDTEAGLASPAKACGLREGDVITHINDEQVGSIEQVQEILQDLDGARMQLRVLRGDAADEVATRAVKCSADGAYKLGAWIRDSMAGIGTLTFVDPRTGLFATLGHGINDVDTAVLLRLQAGSIAPATVAGIVKGQDGRPGELRGQLTSGQPLGTLYANTRSGVFGHLTDLGPFAGQQAREVARPDQVHTGAATILANIMGDRVEEYTVELVKVWQDAPDGRDLMVRITDPRLLEQTGGIVQGMSGSPILQGGRLVGAVTHVLIDHADRGYGIFAERMLAAAEQAAG